MKKNNYEEVLKRLDNLYPDVDVMELSDTRIKEVEVISTGSLIMDNATGVGGFARGKIISLFGGESSAKSSLAFQGIAEAQKTGGRCAIVDAEQAIDKNYCKSLGIDWDKLVIAQPDSAEQAITILIEMVKSGVFDLVVLDSIAALRPKKEMEGDIEDQHMGLLGKLTSRLFRNLRPEVRKTNTAVVIINQMRQTIGGFGSGMVTSGGWAEKFFADIRIQLFRTSKGDKDKGGELVSNVINYKVVKNKLAAPGKAGTFKVFFGKGTVIADEAIDIGIEKGIVEKKGSWYYYGELSLGQGQVNAVTFLEDNPEILAEILEKIKD